MCVCRKSIWCATVGVKILKTNYVLGIAEMNKMNRRLGDHIHGLETRVTILMFTRLFKEKVEK